MMTLHRFNLLAAVAASVILAVGLVALYCVGRANGRTAAAACPRLHAPPPAMLRPDTRFRIAGDPSGDIYTLDSIRRAMPPRRPRR